ncbi:MAG TPA: hypothetical protein PLP34_00060 [Chitinophagaceae bacterium]|nr:hypothetical protein [Chitinophagaceae bacterium]
MLSLYTLLNLGLFRPVSAQKIFSEGVIRYDVFLNDSKKPDGVYLLTIKNGFIKRELAMNSGFNNVVIFNHKTGTSVSMNPEDGNKYALELSASELEAQNERYRYAEITVGNAVDKKAGYSCKEAQVKYKDGASARFCFTEELLPPNEHLNTMFPGLKGIPLIYEVNSSGLKSMRFEANRIETRSVDLKTFDIPKEYKLVSRADLEKLK